MNKYRIMYWLNSIINECYMMGDSLEDVKQRFESLLPYAELSSIKEVKTIPSYCRKRGETNV